MHIINKTVEPYILVSSLKKKITGAKVLNTGKTVLFKQQPEGVFIYLDNVAMDDIDTIVKLETK